ncbi:MAG: hypothetical protein R3C68_03435 [Myxococcota bacterium]
MNTAKPVLPVPMYSTLPSLRVESSASPNVLALRASSVPLRTVPKGVSALKTPGNATHIGPFEGPVQPANLPVPPSPPETHPGSSKRQGIISAAIEILSALFKLVAAYLR